MSGKWLFIWPPKCAGTSVREALSRITGSVSLENLSDWWHSDEIDVLSVGHVKVDDHQFPDRKRFTVSRNPYSRAVSLFHFTRSAPQAEKLPTFEDFCRNPNKRYALPGSKYNKEDLTAPQVAFGRVDVFHRIEDGDEDWGQMIGLRGELPFLNRSNYRVSEDEWKLEYTEELADLIYEKYQEDFERFGYKRNSWQ